MGYRLIFTLITCCSLIWGCTETIPKQAMTAPVKEVFPKEDVLKRGEFEGVIATGMVQVPYGSGLAQLLKDKEGYEYEKPVWAQVSSGQDASIKPGAEFHYKVIKEVPLSIKHDNAQQVGAGQTRAINRLFSMLESDIVKMSLPADCLIVELLIYGYATTKTIHGRIPALLTCDFASVHTYFDIPGKDLERYTTPLRKGEPIKDNYVLAASRAFKVYETCRVHSIFNRPEVSTMETVITSHVVEDSELRGVKLVVKVKSPIN